MSLIVKLTVDKILKKYGIDRVPVDLNKIANEEGIKIVNESMVEEGPKGRISGILYPSPTKDVTAIIGINSEDPPVRKRFTLAHELGHYFLHRPMQVFVDRVYERNEISSLGVNRLEIQANRFAAELLMPAKIVLEKWNKSLKTNNETVDSIIKDMANDFQVSVKSMTLRLSHLRLISPQ